MIERIFKNELSRKRWRRFRNRKTAYFASWAFLVMLVITFTAPMLANSKPLYLNFEGRSYFPVFKYYKPSEFGLTGVHVSYKELELGENDSAIWPMIPWDPYESNEEVDTYPSPPSDVNLMGTDESGRDVFSRILYGFKYSILYAVCVWFTSFILGVSFGATMGFFGGKVDLFGQRIVEVFSTIPKFFLLLILIATFTPSLLTLVIVSTIFDWIQISYYARSEFLKNRKRDFVEAARAMGGSNFRIIFKHILPNSMTPIITFTPFVISAHIIALASLDYLGFGLPVPTPSWGELLAQAQKNFTTAWWLAVFPSLALFGTLTLLNLIGEGVRDALDPNMN
jgi:microcin C transport system permease protein